MSAISTTPPTTPPKVTQSGVATQHSGSAQPVVPGTLSNTATTNSASTVQSSNASPANHSTAQGTAGSQTGIQIQDSTSSNVAPSAPVIKPKSKKPAHLSHISAATWIGVGLTLGGLVVTVYYGAPIMRLAIWTAQNDFREACKSELEAGLQQTAACNKTLGQPAQPPPIKKRSTPDMNKDISGELAPWIITTFSALFFLLCNMLKTLAAQEGKDMKPSNATVQSSAQSDTPNNFSPAGGIPQTPSAIDSLSLDQLTKALFERSDSHMETMISLMKVYLADAIRGSRYSSPRDLQQCKDELIIYMDLYFPPNKFGPRATKHGERTESGSQQCLQSSSPPIKDTIFRDTREFVANADLNKQTTIPEALDISSSTGADVGTRPGIVLTGDVANVWEVVLRPADMIAILSILEVCSLPSMTPMIDLLERLGRMLQGMFITSLGNFGLFALVSGGLIASLLVLVPYCTVSVLVLLAATIVVCVAAATNRDLTTRCWLDEATTTTLGQCLVCYQLFLVFAGLHLIWPLDTMQHKALAWTSGTGLYVWTLTVFRTAYTPIEKRPTRVFSRMF